VGGAWSDRARPLTVGYVSPDLYTHSVSYYAEAPLTHHDPARVKVVWYCVAPHPDARTAELRFLAEASGATWKVRV
jgi:predicted O-linked N-acetylglucosamine transferase (SPINDLY family)